MNVTDSGRASAAATLMIGGLVANVVLTVLAYLLSWLVPGSYEGFWPVLQDLLWLGALAVLAAGMFQLAGAIEQPVLLQLSAGVMILYGLFDTAVGLLAPRATGALGGLVPFVYDASTLFSVVSRGLLLWCLISLAMKTHAWVVPLLGTVGFLTLGRAALSLASMHHLVEPGLYSNPAYRFGMPMLSLFNAGAMLIAGFAVKGAVAGGPNTPALVAAAGLQPAPPAPTPPIADFLIGAILLAVGVGVTVVSLAAASNGGRYVVATGAIGVGVGRIIRGFIKLGRANS